jgi:isocitrate dehydrogenase
VVCGVQRRFFTPGPVVSSLTWEIETRVQFERVRVENPIVELDGDEQTRVIWKMIKEKLIFPFVDMPIDYYDLSIQNRDATDDKVTVEAGNAIKKYHVGTKCATITPDEARVKEFNLKKMYKSPNGTLRNMLDGTVFRAPIVISNIPRFVQGWARPIIIGRHAHADEYTSTGAKLPDGAAGKLELVFTPEPGTTGEEMRMTVFNYKASHHGGVMLGMYNTLSSIESFARSCFSYALQEKLPLYFGTKNTILKQYDGMFKDTFARIYKNEYETQFKQHGLFYEHRLIDDLVATMIKSNGGYIMALKNFAGDVISDIVAQGYGSLGLMTSVLVCPDGKTTLSEAAHGTVTRHYRAHQRGEKTSTNPIASIFAWSRALANRGRLDGNERLIAFAQVLEEAVISAVEHGEMSKDLAVCVYHDEKPPKNSYLLTDELIDRIADRLKHKLARPLEQKHQAVFEPLESSAVVDHQADLH